MIPQNLTGTRGAYRDIPIAKFAVKTAPTSPAEVSSRFSSATPQSVRSRQSRRRAAPAARITSAILGLILSALPIQAGKDFLGADWESYSGFQVSTEMVLPEKETHPSLWFTEEGLAAFRTQLDGDETIRGYWTKVKDHEFLTSTFPEMVPEDKLRISERASANNRQIHQYYGQMTQIPLYCGFMAWMVDDPKQKQAYLDRAKAALMRAFDGPIYELDPTGSGVDKSVDEIYRGVWAQSICAAYDFVQPFLTREEDKHIRARLLKEARYTHENLKSWAAGPHNHLSKPAWGLAAFALTLSDEPDAPDWFRNAMEAANQNTHYHFSADGIYREGGMYYIFSWLNFVPFLHHYKNVSGVDYFEDFQKAFEWGVIARNAKGWIMNVEDAFLRPVPTQMVAKAYTECSSFLAPGIPFSQVLQWNFQTTDYQPFRNIEKISGFNYTGASWDYPKELYELISYDPSIPAHPPTVDPTIFMEGGQTFFRNSWTHEESDQMYLLFHNVPQADNHDHNDTLSFILYAKNQMMASDSGYTRSSYGEDIRYTYYRRPQAHNTITFDDIPLGDFEENQPNPAEDRLNTSFFDLEKKRAPFRKYLGAQWGSAGRTIAYIQGEYFLVLDEVYGQVLDGSKLDGKFDVYFHGGRSSVQQQGKQFTWSYEKDRYGDAATLITYQLAPGAEIAVSDRESTYIKADYAAFPALRTTKAGSSALFGQILYPLAVGEAAPEIEDFSTEKLLASRIIRGTTTDVFLKSFSDKRSNQAGLALDGDFAWIRKQSGEVTHAAGQSTKKLVIDGNTLLAADKRITFALKLDAVSELGIDVEETTVVELITGITIDKVSLNGRAIPFERSPGGIRLELSQDGNYLLN